MTDHPITPPRELLQQWVEKDWHHSKAKHIEFELYLADRAAQWGYEQRGGVNEVNEAELQKARDQELKACCEWLKDVGYAGIGADLRAARRPKPPSLAKTATYELDEAVMRGDCITTTDAMPHLRAALKRLAELEDSSHA